MKTMKYTCWVVSVLALIGTFWGLFALERTMMGQSWAVATFSFIAGCLFHTMDRSEERD